MSGGSSAPYIAALQRFDDRARAALARAARVAASRERPEVSTTDVLLAAFQGPSAELQILLRHFGIEAAMLVQRLGEPRDGGPLPALPLAAAVRELILAAPAQAERTGSVRVSDTHLVLAIASSGEAPLLAELGFDPAAAEQIVRFSVVS